jgi:hypothetical protein
LGSTDNGSWDWSWNRSCSSIICEVTCFKNERSKYDHLSWVSSDHATAFGSVRLTLSPSYRPNLSLARFIGHSIGVCPRIESTWSGEAEPTPSFQ